MSFDRHREAVLIGGTERRRIVVVDYDPAWPAQYKCERDRIAQALGPRALRIEHVGSTSVPRLAAKPIIDVLVTVANADDERWFASALEPLGYAELKRTLAKRDWPDMNHYADAKGPFIESVLARVVRWTLMLLRR